MSRSSRWAPRSSLTRPRQRIDPDLRQRRRPHPDRANAAKYNFLYAPFTAHYKYGKILPNVGFTYKVTDPISIFGSYAEGFSAPRTDNL